jgi:DNA-binding response OmpR family regulator
MRTNGRSSRPTALVIDDDPRCRAMIARTLHEKGFEVLEAGDGYLGIGILSRRSADLGFLVVDTEMPGVHGWEVIRFARSKVPTIPILRLGREDDVVPAGDYEPFRTLPAVAKPLTPATLLASVRGCERFSRVRRAFR